MGHTHLLLKIPLILTNTFLFDIPEWYINLKSPSEEEYKLCEQTFGLNKKIFFRNHFYLSMTRVLQNGGPNVWNTNLNCFLVRITRVLI